MKRLITAVLVIAILLLSACGGSSTDAELKNYLDQVELIIEELGDITSELVNITEDTGPFGAKNADLILADYSEKYDDLLSRFEAIEYPNDAIKLREHTINIITYHKKMVDEMTEYAITSENKHIDIAESYAIDAEDSRLLAMDEWDRLSDIAGEGDGINVLHIFLGLIGLAIVVSIAFFVLHLTLGAGIGIIAGITSAIGAIIRKIKKE